MSRCVVWALYTSNVLVRPHKPAWPTDGVHVNVLLGTASCRLSTPMHGFRWEKAGRPENRHGSCRVTPWTRSTYLTSLLRS